MLYRDTAAQCGDAVDQLQWREMQLVGLGTASVSVEVVAGFAVLFATAVDEFDG